MKKILQSLIVLSLFALSISAIASFTAPTQAPPAGNTPSAINVGNDTQAKVGGLSVGGLLSTGYGIFNANVEIGGTLKVAGGNPAQDKVLASDNTGLASWKSLSELGGGVGGEGGWTDEGTVVRLTTLTDNVAIGNNSVIFKQNSNPGLPNRTYIHTQNGHGNFFAGVNAGNLSLTGGGLTGVGANALLSLTTGLGDTAFGHNALSANTTGSNNSAVGVNSLDANTIGGFNTAMGKESLGNNTTGNYNTSVGAESMSDNVGGKENSAFGASALNHNRGNFNTAVGYGALLNNTLGYGNTAIGHNAGTVLEAGENSFSNTTAIGYKAEVNASNKVRIGNPLVTWIGGQVGWTNASDIRYKKDIENIDLGLDFINNLRPVSYHMKNDADTDGLSYGFIAQEVEKVLGDRKTKLIETENTIEGMKYMRYNDLIAPMVKAIQEQQKEIELLKAEIELLKNK